MTIDEAITKYKEIANTDANCPAHCNISCEKCVQESKQLAAWLEDYKRLKELFSKTFIKDCNTCEQEIYQKAYKEGQDKGFSDSHFFGYNKAIDDFAEKLKPIIDEKIKGWTNSDDLRRWCERSIDEIAEQLKASEKNE